MIKKCSKCGEEKPATLEYFHKFRNGLTAECKPCRAERGKAYYEANKEAIAEREKAYYRTPKGKFADIKRVAKRRDINFSLPFDLYESQLWGKPCHYCGCEIEATGLDRKDNGKGYEVGNVVPCCFDCNNKKKTKPYQVFIEEMINE